MSAPASTCLAEEDILTIQVSPEYSVEKKDSSTWHGIGCALDIDYGIDEYLSLDFIAGYDYSWLKKNSDSNSHSIRLGLGAKYGLDATEFVPYLASGLEMYMDNTGGSGFEPNLSAYIAIGLDWIITDDFLAGIEARYHLLVTDVEHLVATFGIKLGWRIDML
ncbi:MAG: porin family protein [Deltaproteobacteria bacterium]|nr:porin family protein [Deltaproteobacteria bacterium]